MCFSAEVSFASGVVISAIGVAAVKKEQTPSRYLFAVIPLFFGFQQFIEGVLWISLQHSAYAYMHSVATAVFLIMADVVWPVMVPLSFLFMEKSKSRSNYLRLLLLLGIITSAYYAYGLMNFPFTSKIHNFHILYQIDFFKELRLYSFVAYLMVTILPFFLSTVPKTKMLGMLMFLACVVSALFYTQYLISIWCFFAALLSGGIYWALSMTESTSKIKAYLNKVE